MRAALRPPTGGFALEVKAGAAVNQAPTVTTTGNEVGYSIEKRAAPGVGRRHSPCKLSYGRRSPWKN
jgi:hypothetical protein